MHSANVKYKNYYQNSIYHQQQATQNRHTTPFGRTVVSHKAMPKKRKRNPIANICALGLLVLLGMYVIPYGLKNVVFPFFDYSLYPDIKADTNTIAAPTSNYIYDSFFLNTRFLSDTTMQNKMADLYLTSEMNSLKSKLTSLMSNYKTIEPSIFVWEFDSGRYVDINAEKQFSAASIIKIPVLLETFKAIEANELKIDETMTLTDYYRSEGSGGLQYQREGNTYTIDALARTMIEDSDNTATNMLVAALGGMPRVNSAMKSWGIDNTFIKNWLPDLDGTNYTTTKDLAKMLYNIENSSFLSTKSKSYIYDYMGHVENNRLIQAGLPQNAKFLHKTGDIGKTLGDAGIVTTHNGKKYLVAIIANRPYNSPQGKNFIVQASTIIYNHISSKSY